MYCVNFHPAEVIFLYLTFVSVLTNMLYRAFNHISLSYLDGVNCWLQVIVSPELKQSKPLLMLTLGLNTMR